MPFLHLVAGTFAAKVVNETLRALGRDEEALGDHDVLAEGPRGAATIDGPPRRNPTVSRDTLTPA